MDLDLVELDAAMVAKMGDMSEVQGVTADAPQSPPRRFLRLDDAGNAAAAQVGHLVGDV